MPISVKIEKASLGYVCLWLKAHFDSIVSGEGPFAIFMKQLWKMVKFSWKFF